MIRETHRGVIDVCARGPCRPCPRLACVGGLDYPAGLFERSPVTDAGGRFSPEEPSRWASKKPIEKPRQRRLSSLSRLALSVSATLLKRAASRIPDKPEALGSRAPSTIRNRTEADGGEKNRRAVHPSRAFALC